jgi:hypothetical protein
MDFATSFRAALTANPAYAGTLHGRMVLRALDDPTSPRSARVIARAERETRGRYGDAAPATDWSYFWTVLERVATVLSIFATLLMLFTPAPGGPDMLADMTAMADPTPAEIQELTTQLTALVNAPPYNGDYSAAFAHYAGPDGLIDSAGLTQLLTDANIGNRFTRHFWASGIMEALDTNKDGRLSLAEIQAAIAANQR